MSSFFSPPFVLFLLVAFLTFFSCCFGFCCLVLVVMICLVVYCLVWVLLLGVSATTSCGCWCFALVVVSSRCHSFALVLLLFHIGVVFSH